ncbi:MAG TPA: AAA family ATPase, partial [Armatimonadota bacterium]|nr:AAA family ATPase [Armatimonadota bacterium]
MLERGAGQVLTVNGEAGIGKSRLMAEWQAELRGRVQWLEGRAFAYTGGLAYGPFLDLFRRYAGISDDASEAQTRLRMHQVVDRFFPGDVEARAIWARMLAMPHSDEEARALSAVPPEMVRHRLIALFERVFECLAGEQPAVLVIEDLHWSDPSSLDLIQRLLPLTRRVPLAIACVFRPGVQALDRLQQVIAEQYRDRHLAIRLEALEEAASTAMVRQLLTLSELPESLRTLIVNKAEGNPFFLEEVIRALIERGALVRAEAGQGWTTTPLIEAVSVPDTLQGVLMARLDRLPAETKWVVQQASVIGRTFLYRVLARLAERAAGLDADLVHLEREELIRERARDPEVEYVFKHALTQEVAYQSLLVPRRRELHARVGDALASLFPERLDEFSSVLGEHFLRAEEWEQAVQYL